MTQYCTFVLDGHLFGIPVASVQEVLREQAVTPVPLAAPEVSGLINLRGQIVTSLNLRERLRLAGQPADEQSVSVVVRTLDGGAVSLVVDRVGDVVEPDPGSLAPFAPIKEPSDRPGRYFEICSGVPYLRIGIEIVQRWALIENKRP